MAYAAVTDVQDRLPYTMSTEQETICANLLEDCAVMIDASAKNATNDAKKVASCRMVIRALGNPADAQMPIGASQGSISALGYSQSWTMGSGATGELYLSRQDKLLLGIGNKIGSRSPLEPISEESGD